MSDRFDLIVIGAGPGGYVAAIRAAQLGMKVACVDRGPALGGTCLNIGCIPSKALLDSSELYYLARARFQHHGITTAGLKIDLTQMLGRKNKVVKGLTDGIAFLFKKNKVTFIQGNARLLGRDKIAVEATENRELEAVNIILATGSEPTPLPMMPFDGESIVSSTEALAFERVPEHLIVVGGGYIGLELGSVWARLGAKVTVLEFLPRILALSDAELATVLQKSLIKQGLEFHVNTRVTGAARKGKQVNVRAETDGKAVQFEGDKVLVAVGRRPCTQGLGLKEAGVKVEDKTGRVLVDEKFQTSMPGVYAIGDLIAGPMLAHKASEEGIAVAELLAGKAGHVNYAAIPSVIFTAPELASVGLTEEQLKESGRKYRAGKFSFANNSRARCLDETEGLVKVLTDAATDRILGVHILGARASEMIAESVLALEFAGSAEDIARTCHAHPTLSEAVAEAARAAWSMPLQT
jgi:dihydrolipoamide dehydrogenase